MTNRHRCGTNILTMTRWARCHLPSSRNLRQNKWLTCEYLQAAPANWTLLRPLLRRIIETRWNSCRTSRRTCSRVLSNKQNIPPMALRSSRSLSTMLLVRQTIKSISMSPAAPPGNMAQRQFQTTLSIPTQVHLLINTIASSSTRSRATGILMMIRYSIRWTIIRHLSTNRRWVAMAAKQNI